MTAYIYQDSLESERLITRKLTVSDIEIWAKFFEDKEAVEFFPNLELNSNTEMAEYMINKQLERYSDMRYGHQAILDKQTKSLIGLCGLLTQTVDDNIEIEVGYHIFKNYWGRGYAPEAAKLFIDYAFKNNLAQSIISIIDVGNVKSQRVAEKNGMAREKQIKWLHEEEVYIYRIIKSNWK